MRICLVVLGCIAITLGSARGDDGKLLHLGLTNDGWQVFEYDLSKQTTRQITFSKGDKSLPRFNKSLGAVTFRDSRGYVYTCHNGKESRWSEKMGVCARYVIIDKGERVLYTWWSAGDKCYHHLWSQGRGDASPLPFKRPDMGSFAQLALSPDEKRLVASQIVGNYEERLVLLVLSDKGSAMYLTPASYRATHPSWSLDGERILFSQTQGADSYDLYEMDIATQTCSPLVVSPDANEFSPVEGKGGVSVYFERKANGQSELAVLNRKDGVIGRLELSYPARSPYWHE